jgi:maltose alpha-D-glucosyltransferase/alpha-amylase
MNLDLNQLKESLSSQRWFGDKGRSITDVSMLDIGVLEEGSETLALALIEVTFESGPVSLYQVPLLFNGEGGVRHATDEPHRLGMLGTLMGHGTPIQGENGTFHFSGPALDPTNPPGSDSTRSIGTEQSNTTLVMDEAVALKLFRKVEAGANPDLELNRVLAMRGFEHIPPHLGELFYESDGDEAIQIDLGIAQRFIADGEEGWAYVQRELKRLFEEIHEQDAPEDRPVLIAERASGLLNAIEELGEATASMHVVFSRDDLEFELLSEPLDIGDLKELCVNALESLKESSAHVPELAVMTSDIEARLENAAAITEAGSKTRIHGDFHLGQVLHEPRKWLILDFEGEPARTLEERRAKQSPLKDVAGMLRSFSYAAYAALFGMAAPDSDEWNALEPWALEWELLARSHFAQAYMSRSHEGNFLPSERDALLALLDIFEIDKALYEIRYERSHRPDWLRIPLRGLSQIIERGENR